MYYCSYSSRPQYEFISLVFPCISFCLQFQGIYNVFYSPISLLFPQNLIPRTHLRYIECFRRSRAYLRGLTTPFFNSGGSESVTAYLVSMGILESAGKHFSFLRIKIFRRNCMEYTEWKGIQGTNWIHRFFITSYPDMK